MNKGPVQNWHFAQVLLYLKIDFLAGSFINTKTINADHIQIREPFLPSKQISIDIPWYNGANQTLRKKVIFDSNLHTKSLIFTLLDFLRAKSALPDRRLQYTGQKLGLMLDCYSTSILNLNLNQIKYSSNSEPHEWIETKKMKHHRKSNRASSDVIS